MDRRPTPEEVRQATAFAKTRVAIAFTAARQERSMPRRHRLEAEADEAVTALGNMALRVLAAEGKSDG